MYNKYFITWWNSLSLQKLTDSVHPGAFPDGDTDVKVRYRDDNQRDDVDSHSRPRHVEPLSPRRGEDRPTLVPTCPSVNFAVAPDTQLW